MKVMFLCSIFLKRVCPCSSKVTLSNKVVPLFDENVKVEPKLNLGFFAVCLGCLTRLLHALA